MTSTENQKPIHQGRNIKRFREMAGLKQEALADMLGGEWSQKKVSTIEGREVIEDSLLDELSKVLRVPQSAIKTLTDDSVFQMIQNNFHDQALQNFNYQCTINPFDEMKKLMVDKDELVKALVKEKDEKSTVLERLDELNKALLKEKDEKISLLHSLLENKK